MSLATAKNGMNYEVTGSKTASNGTVRAIALKAADQLGTPSLLWLLVKRHKVGLLAVGNIVLVLNWVFPEWMQLVKSII